MSSLLPGKTKPLNTFSDFSPQSLLRDGPFEVKHQWSLSVSAPINIAVQMNVTTRLPSPEAPPPQYPPRTI